MSSDTVDLAAAAWRALPDGVVVVEPDGTVLAANSTALLALGVSGDGPPGRLTDRLAARTGATLGTMLSAAQAGGWCGEVGRPEGDRDEGPWELRLVPLDRAEPPGRLVGVLRDLRERRARERAGQELLSTVLHDVKGPLTVILGYAELLTDPGESPSRAQVVDTLARIADCGEQIHALVSNYGVHARVETGRLPSERRPVDVGELLDVVTAQHGQRAVRAGVTLAVETTDLPSIPGDRSQLERALANLVGNAVKFTPSGGRITVRAAHVGDLVEIAVQDTGPGIGGQDAERIFAKHAFGRAARRGEGVGLGLAVARAIARAHGGDVIVTSVPGEGATFTLRLPTTADAAST